MKPEKTNRGHRTFEAASAKPSSQHYELRLYVAGATHHSMVAVKNIKIICEKYLKNNYTLHIIDVYQQPESAKEYEIIAAPTLIKSAPAPTRRLVGDMSNTKKVLAGLNLMDHYDTNHG